MDQITDIIQQAKDLNIRLYIKNDQLAFTVAKGGFPPALKALVGRNKDQIIEHLKSQKAASKPTINVVSREGDLLLSYAQQRLWFIDHMDGSSAQYNMPAALSVHGEFSADAGEQAFARIIERHESLRTTFTKKHDDVVQCINSNPQFTLARFNLLGLSEDEQQSKVEQLIDADARTPFDLSCDLMLRAGYIELTGNKSVLLFNMHHIASDGWSIGVLIKEFNQQYQAVLEGNPDPLPALAVQYADYAHWQREWLEQEMDKQMDYWRAQLADLPPVHSLPIDFVRPTHQTFSGDNISFSLGGAKTAELKQLALSQQVTLFMLLQGVFSLLLSRYANNEDSVVGTPVANRRHQQLEPLIGFFANTLVLRVNCGQDLSFEQYLQHVKTVNLDAQSHQDIPFETLVEQLKPTRSTAYSPLFQIMFSMGVNQGKAQAQDQKSNDSVSFKALQSTVNSAKFDLHLSAAQTPNGLSFNIEYNTDLFCENTIDHLGQHFLTLLQSAIAEPSANIHQLPLLSKTEHHDMVHKLNRGPDVAIDEQCIHQLFEWRVAQSPNDIAVEFGDEQMTYSELNRRANQLAVYLRIKGVGTGTLVGLCVARSFELQIAILAILKAGGAYVPFDPNNPPSRLLYMVEDSSISLMITNIFDNEFTERFNIETILKEGGCEGIETLNLDAPQVQQQLSQLSSRNPLQNHSDEISSSDAAYIIYTSGTTGNPKGVVQHHQTITNLVHGLAANERLGQQLKTLQFSPVSFDISLQEMATCWLNNSALVYISEHDKQSLVNLPDILLKQGIERLYLPPAVLLWLAETAIERGLNFNVLQEVSAAGDSLNITEHLSEFMRQHPKCKLWNSYGPTEMHVVTTALIDDCSVGAQPSIGKFIANTKGYIVNSLRSIQPRGAVGELYLAGAGMAIGYLNRPQLTAQLFFNNALIENERIYKTGDLVRMLPDGSLAYMGRVDEQVQIRGLRVELGEIQSQLAKLPGVKSAVVVVGEQQRLIAFVTAIDGMVDLESTLKQRLQAVLPEHMVPTTYRVLDDIPLTVNGKIDRKTLLNLDTTDAGETFVKPQSNSEITLAQIWYKLLKLAVDELSATDNFFNLGGHSLLSVRLVSQVSEYFDVDLSVRDIFDAPQLDQLARLIDAKKGFISKAVVRTPVVAIAREGETQFNTSFAQQRLWFIDQLEGTSTQYNMPGAIRIEGAFDVTLAQSAFERIIERHEPLRTVFSRGAEGCVQHILGEFDFVMDTFDVTEQPQDLAVLLASQAARPFDLSRDLMLRAGFITTGPDTGVLIFNLHHIASDGWSMGVLIDEFSQQYQALLEGKPNPLPALEIKYVDYAYWQRNWLSGAVLQDQLDYWTHQLKDLAQVHGLALDKPRPAEQTYNGAKHSIQLSGEQTAALKQLALDNNVTLFMLLHGAFSVLLSRHANGHGANESDIVIGTTVANRLQKELSLLIGFFVNTLVLRVQFDVNDSFTALLGKVKNINLDAQANQDVPFEHLVERLNPVRSVNHSPLFQIMFSMNNNDMMSESTSALSALKMQALASNQVTAKFDLSLNAVDTPNALVFDFEYNTDLFEASTIIAMAGHFEQLLSAVLANPNTKVGQLPMLSDSEQQKLLFDLNGLNEGYRPAETATSMAALFEQRVCESPDRIALVQDAKQLSYSQLNSQANQLAGYLSGLGVGHDTLVAICCDRSLDMVVGLLAIIKAGGAYVPIDPTYPKARIDFMLSDGRISLLLCQQHLAANVDFQGQTVFIDALDRKNRLSEYCIENPAQTAVDDPLAYVCYTSGTTGQPKGVMVRQAGVLRLVGATEQLNLDAGTVFLQASTLAFDAATLEIWGCLLNGGQLVLYPSELPTLEGINAQIEQFDINTMWLTAPLFSLWSHQLPATTSLKTVLAGGDVLDPCAVERVYNQYPEIEVINGDGPTENTTFTTCFKVPRDFDLKQPLPLGKAIKSTYNYVLSPSKQLVPFGAVGELYTAGAGLARGYLNRPKLTEAQFICNPFSVRSFKDRLYKTGDLVRYLPNGDLAFEGRTDNQVKIRGYRIELGEIEHQLGQLSGVQSAVVVVHEHQGDKRLVAYVVAYVEAYVVVKLSENDLVEQLKNLLPEHMMPSQLIVVEQMPLTANGKIDKTALPSPTDSVMVGEFVALTSETERKLAQLWADLLGCDVTKVGRQANFFALGGHSLLLIKLLSELAEQFELELSLKAVMGRQVLNDLAALIDEEQLTNSVTVDDDYELDDDEMEFTL